MNAFWFQSLAISFLVLAVGCAGPQVNLSREDQLLAEGYPQEYVNGFQVRYESFCAEIIVRKSLPLSPWEAAYCMGRNVELRIEQEPKQSKSYLQGRTDGNRLAGHHALDAELQRQQQWQQTYYMTQDLVRDHMVRNLQAPKFNK